MKILFIGSLISAEQMEELNNHSREKASIAPVNYETMLIKGLVQNGADIECLSVPAVATFPRSDYKKLHSKTEFLFEKVKVNWVPFVNIQGLKQATIKRSITRFLKQWLEDNKEIEEKVVLMYSIYPPYTAPATELCRKYGCPLCAVITDLPEYMYSWKNATGIRGWYSQRLSKQMVFLQSKCDKYVLFTKPMAKRMGIEEKPYIVSEGFCDSEIFDKIPKNIPKYEKKTIVYGGNLSKLYGIRPLLDGFMSTDVDAELHLYGAGSDAEYVKECAKKDSRIKFFGRVSRTDLLTALVKSHALVINKPTSDDYSNYSFSSKILEYMVSGTPVLTTKIGGMPEEYYPYFYFIEDETIPGIASAIEKMVRIEYAELFSRGQVAKEFASHEKNYLNQTKAILSFLEDNWKGKCG